MRANRASEIRSLLLLTIGLIAPATGCGVRGSGVYGEESRSFDELVGVRNETSIHVEIEARAGATQSVVVGCDENLIEHIETRVEGGVLVIRQREGSWLQPDTVCQVVVVTARLEEVAVAGSGNISVWSETDVPVLASVRIEGSGDLHIEQPVTSAELDLSSEGSGHLTLERFEGDALSAHIAGSGSIEVHEGASTTTTAIIEGSGDIDLAQVTTAACRAETMGSGTVELRCTESIDAHIASSGSVVVYGDPATRDELDEGSGSIVYR